MKTFNVSVFYLFNDFKVGWFLLFGSCTPYRYRLQGPNSWEGARQAILTQNKRQGKTLIFVSFTFILRYRVECPLRGQHKTTQDRSVKHTMNVIRIFPFIFLTLILLTVFKCIF